MVRKLPLFIILAGLVVVGIGIWQIVETNFQTDASLKEAKRIVAQAESRYDDEDSFKNPKKIDPPKFGDTVGLLTIPKIKSELAIVEGTDPNDLKKGVGHYKGSYFPGENGQIVLSGHRDTVFRRLGELKPGDIFEVAMPNGKFKYELTNTKIVDADDRSIITLQNTQEELIVITCYPFRFVGNAPQRYIIYAKPI
ncbi:class D sortase [Neobacillus sp. CF12]|uniref:class D sortase n=1 Tax=Neobacillus sp. CF12 TaxID=3055864 RepID=UPI0025A0AD25|nr:class D sortase [Neobacillus sp. CF12]MDM5330800.1 class D sortase [Neobacillus sp. CF12]